MKTLIFNGSPRKNGDSAGLIGLIEKELNHEFKRVDAYYCKISPCIDCRYCVNYEGCSIDDGMTELYKYIEECDNIIIVSPIYFSELTGPLLSVLSRLQMYFCSKFFRKKEILQKPKRGYSILLGGGNGNAERAEKTAKDLLKHMKCQSSIGVIYHDTDNLRAINHKETVEEVLKIAHMCNKG